MTPRCLVTGKLAHRTAGGAWALAYAAWERRGEALRAYRCPWCGCWHTTKRWRRAP